MRTRRRTNESLADVVTAELYWDPVLDARAIAVAADDGRVTLRGTVGTLTEKREAKAAAERVLGVVSVDDALEVQLIDSDRARDDAKVRADVLQAMMINRVVPPTVNVEVEAASSLGQVAEPVGDPE
jgi:hypothetical protein